MQNSPLAISLNKLTRIISFALKNGLEKSISIPQITVFGSKYTGKSSVVERLIGINFLTKGFRTDLQTIQFNFVYSPLISQPQFQIIRIAEQSSIPKKYKDINEVQKIIQELKFKYEISAKEYDSNQSILLKIYSKFWPNFTLLDLPGLQSHIVMNSPSIKFGLARQRIIKQLSKQDSIILGVLAANRDNSIGEMLKVRGEVDLKGERTLACITKIDLMDRGTDAMDLLMNRQSPMRYGPIGVLNSSRLSSEQPITQEKNLKEEYNFFSSHKAYKTLPLDVWGIHSLANKLTSIIYSAKREEIQQISKLVEKRMKQLALQSQLNNMEESQLKEILQLLRLINEQIEINQASKLSFEILTKVNQDNLKKHSYLPNKDPYKLQKEKADLQKIHENIERKKISFNKLFGL